MNSQEQYNHKAALIEDLLAAPFVAAANANAKMAKEQVRFLIETCFNDNGESFSPKMISLTVRKNDQTHDSDEENLTFELPLITIIPLNSLCVKDINVVFDMEIVSLLHEHGTEDDDSGKKNIEMRGSVATSDNDNTAQKRRQSKMSVEITGGSIPLPLGLKTILKFYSNNIQLKS